MTAMTIALVLLVIAGGAAVVRRLGSNHQRVTAWPTSSADLPGDRDAARLHRDLVAAASARPLGGTRPRLVRSGASARRPVRPATRAA